MSRVVLGFADGTSFFAGLTMSLVADLLILRFPRKTIRAALNVLGLAGMVFVVMSATPLPVLAYAVWLTSAGVSLALGNIARPGRHLPRILGALVLVTTATFGLAELRHAFLPHLSAPRGTTVYVVGDSISAGVGSKERCWPAVFAEMTSFPVVNLAQAGATVETALRQADRAVQLNSMVILEIGGNDILGGTDAATFRERLDLLVSSLRLHQHRILMLELPLFPFQNAFGAAQRSVAKQHGCLLLPKRRFAAVLGAENGTLDGLHLSQKGHDSMAKVLAGVVHVE